MICYFFFFNHTAATEIYTLSLHDALPISQLRGRDVERHGLRTRRYGDVLGPVQHRHGRRASARARPARPDRKSTRLNSSHLGISYAVFCLKKKKKQITQGLLGREAR